MNIVKTPQGPVELRPPEPAQLRALRELLPLGVVQYEKPFKGARYGVVMKCGDREAFAVKQQPVEVAAEKGETCFMANSILIAISPRTYLENGFAGLMMPCARHAVTKAPRTNRSCGFKRFVSARLVSE
jgi:hypothetical protein